MISNTTNNLLKNGAKTFLFGFFSAESPSNMLGYQNLISKLGSHSLFWIENLAIPPNAERL